MYTIYSAHRTKKLSTGSPERLIIISVLFVHLRYEGDSRGHCYYGVGRDKILTFLMNNYAFTHGSAWRGLGIGMGLFFL